MLRNVNPEIIQDDFEKELLLTMCVPVVQGPCLIRDASVTSIILMLIREDRREHRGPQYPAAAVAGEAD